MQSSPRTASWLMERKIPPVPFRLTRGRKCGPLGTTLGSIISAVRDCRLYRKRTRHPECDAVENLQKHLFDRRPQEQTDFVDDPHMQPQLSLQLQRLSEAKKQRNGSKGSGESPSGPLVGERVLPEGARVRTAPSPPISGKNYQTNGAQNECPSGPTLQGDHRSV